MWYLSLNSAQPPISSQMASLTFNIYQPSHTLRLLGHMYRTVQWERVRSELVSEVMVPAFSLAQGRHNLY